MLEKNDNLFLSLTSCTHFHCSLTKTLGTTYLSTLLLVSDSISASFAFRASSSAFCLFTVCLAAESKHTYKMQKPLDQDSSRGTLPIV